MITDLNQLDLNKRYTYLEYLSWQFKERVELIKGKICKIAPAPNVKHQKVSMYITREILKNLKSKNCQLFSAPFDVRLPVSKHKEKYDTVVQPDLCIICDASKLDEQSCNGAPDLVIEILSPGNSPREMKEKFELYESAEVPEYWIVDPEREDVLVYTLDKSKKYIGSKPFIAGESIESKVIRGLIIEVEKIFIA